MGYAALLESELLRQYGGIRRVYRKKEEIVLIELGFGIDKSHMNILQDIFNLWKEREKFEPQWKKKMAAFQEKNRQEQRKVCDTFFLCKPVNEINAEDIPEMIRQWKEFNWVFDRAMAKAVELLQENPFVGEYFDGELMEQILEMEEEFYTAHSGELKAIVKGALEKSKTHEWLYEEAQFEFVNKVNAVSRKLKN